MQKKMIFDAFTLLIREKNVAIYALLRCKIFSLKIWVCKILDKFHVCRQLLEYSLWIVYFKFYKLSFQTTLLFFRILVVQTLFVLNNG